MQQQSANESSKQYMHYSATVTMNIKLTIKVVIAVQQSASTTVRSSINFTIWIFLYTIQSVVSRDCVNTLIINFKKRPGFFIIFWLRYIFFIWNDWYIMCRTFSQCNWRWWIRRSIEIIFSVTNSFLEPFRFCVSLVTVNAFLFKLKI